MADTGVWNPAYGGGYELMMLLPPGTDTRPIARMRVRLTANDAQLPEHSNQRRGPDGHVYVEQFWGGSAHDFFNALLGTWNHWRSLFDEIMPVDIPDPWLLDAARAGITLSRCSYHGLEPTYQIGEGAYTKLRSAATALFPVAITNTSGRHQLELAAPARPYARTT